MVRKGRKHLVLTIHQVTDVIDGGEFVARIRRLEILREDRKGFWEEWSYSNTAHPWRNDRYS